MFIHAPPNTILRINQLWAVLSSDETGEGVCAIPFGGTMLPLIAADEARLESFLPIAHQIATESGKKVKIVRFTVREEIMEIEP